MDWGSGGRTSFFHEGVLCWQAFERVDPTRFPIRNKCHLPGNQTRFSSGWKSFRERVSQVTTDNFKELPITVTKVYSILRHVCEEFLKDFVIFGRILAMDPKNSEGFLRFQVASWKWILRIPKGFCDFGSHPKIKSVEGPSNSRTFGFIG